MPKKAAINFPQSITELSNCLNDADFLKALFIGSTNFSAQLEGFSNEKNVKEKQLKKFHATLWKYLSRMKTRPTPYGLFAGVGVGGWFEADKIIVNNEDSKTITRIDMHHVCGLLDRISSHSRSSNFTLRVNSSLYSVNNLIRYAKYERVSDRRVHNLMQLTTNPILNWVITNVKFGISYSELKVKLGEQFKLEDISIEKYIARLIEVQVLVTECEPMLTDSTKIHQLINTLANNIVNNDARQLAERLILIFQQLDLINQKPHANKEHYLKLYRNIANLSESSQSKDVVQVDWYPGTSSASLSQKYQGRILSVMDALHRFSRPQRSERLKLFTENFHNRFQDQEVSLLLALDNECGIGYPTRDSNGVSPYLDELPLVSSSVASQLTLNDRDIYLMRKLYESIENGDKVLRFKSSELPVYRTELRAAPTISVMFKVLDIDQEIIHFICAGGASSSINLINRFAHGNDQVLGIINDLVTFEERSYQDCLLAEFVHLPEGRLGNILLRPAIRKYEIPYLAQSSLSDEQQIEPHDIRISVRNNRIILRSFKHNRIIIPRSSTAHNYELNSLPLYKFLCDLQFQDIDDSSFDFYWGNWSSHFPFLPRVEIDKVVVSPATWFLEVKTLRTEILETNPFETVNQWRLKHKLPVHCLVKENDNELYIDFENPVSVTAFIDVIKTKVTVEIVEYLFNSDAPLIRNTDGEPFNNEILAFLYNPKFKHNVSTSKIRSSKSTVQRRLLPNEGWIFFKIYCGLKMSDMLLVENIFNIKRALEDQGIIDNWFFVRYADPEPHLRLRFKTTHGLTGRIIQLVEQNLETLVKTDIITKYQIEQYDRELERYGFNTIEEVERIFGIESNLTIKFLQAGEVDDQQRLLFALMACDDLLSCFDFSADTRLKWYENLFNNFFSEHGGRKELKVALANQYRIIKNDIDNFFRGSDTSVAIVEMLRMRKAELKSPCKLILKLLKNNDEGALLFDIVSSIMHMNINRIFISRQRTHELVIYHHLMHHTRTNLIRANQVS